MILQLTIPDPLLKRLETLCSDVPTAVLEGFAVEAYRHDSAQGRGRILHPHAPAALRALVRNPPKWQQIVPAMADRLPGGPTAWGNVSGVGLRAG